MINKINLLHNIFVCFLQFHIYFFCTIFIFSFLSSFSAVLIWLALLFVGLSFLPIILYFYFYLLYFYDCKNEYGSSSYLFMFLSLMPPIFPISLASLASLISFNSLKSLISLISLMSLISLLLLKTAVVAYNYLLILSVFYFFINLLLFDMSAVVSSSCK